MKKIIPTLLVISNFAFVSLAQSNYIDTSFGVNGVSNIKVANFLDEDLSHGFSYTKANKIVNLSIGLNDSNEDITLVAQYNSDGTLDANFANNGVLELTTFLGFDVITDASNNVYISGISATSGRLSILGLDSSGNTVTGFGTNGIATINEAVISIGHSIKIDGNNKFLIAGTANIVDEQQLIVARFNSDGTADSSFGTNGVLRVNISNVVTDEELFNINLSLFDDNSILITGDVDTPEDATPNGNKEYNEFAVRIDASGILDNSFGDNGLSIFYDITASQGDVYASYILSNNKVLLSISGFDSASNEINGLLRLNVNGTIDTSFGTNGLLSLISDDYVIFELFQSITDSDIFVLGENASGNSILKIDETGVIDTSFANNGVLPIDFPGISITDLIGNAIELPDGKILVSGFRESEDGFIMGRYFKDEQLSLNKESLLALQLYPNPVNNHLNMVSNNNIDSYMIYQMDGKLILDEKLDSKIVHVDVSSFKKGIYIVKVIGDNAIKAIKFSKL